MTDEKQERDTPRKVREDLTAKIEELEAKIESMKQSDTQLLSSRLDQLTHAIVESAHIMGWPKDLLESNGIRAYDKKTDKLSIRQ